MECVIRTTDILGDVEELVLPMMSDADCLALGDADREFGQGGFDVADFLNPAVYTKVETEIRGVYDDDSAEWKPRCQCEHASHFDAGSAHKYGASIARATVKLPTCYGTFVVCRACADAGHMQI
jgi:hypothetical protein